jgi:hypothetical protein
MGFDSGDSRALDGIFARKPQFRWYSTGAPGARLGSDAVDRPSLVRYFEKRHALGERLVLRSFRFTGNSDAGAELYGNFTYTVLRTTPETGAALFRGKGAATCYADRPAVLIVWSMAASR